MSPIFKQIIYVIVAIAAIVYLLRIVGDINI